jgi:uncharacterized SAM-binding protein YcdF (DUF218 family)
VSARRRSAQPRAPGDAIAPRKRWKRNCGIALVLLAALGLGAEAVFWLGGSLASMPAVDGHCAVLVLGYPSRADGSPDPTQQIRVTAGVDAFRRNHCERLVISGGAAHSASIEAEVMARLATEQGVPATAIAIEARARNTWQNVEYSLPLLDGFEHLFVASDTLHAYRGRRYLCRQRPLLCQRVAVAPAHDPFARPWWKIGAVLYELHAWIRDRLVYE